LIGFQKEVKGYIMGMTTEREMIEITSL